MASEHVVADSSNIGQQLLYSLHGGAFTGPEMLINMSLALVLGLLLASVYRYTHKGLSYSQSFTLTIVFVTTIVAMTLMAIESSLARAFALVGALSIIRFRTVVKDTKDTADDIYAIISASDYAYTLTPQKVGKTADFIYKIGAIKTKPSSWKDLFFPEVQALPGD